MPPTEQELVELQAAVQRIREHVREAGKELDAAELERIVEEARRDSAKRRP